YLWGRDLLIAPVFQKLATTRDVYLPAGDWYDWWTNDKVAGGHTVTRDVDLATMPIYVRAGAIIPGDPVRQYTSEATGDPTTIRVYRGANGQFTLYDDDGISQEYLHGRGTWTRFSWNDTSRELAIAPAPPAGATNVTARRAFKVLILPDGVTRDVAYTGRATRVTIP
ncbi:MAG: DUF5110 domain-containing protein, partial [bacterium]